jgi:hypothetical protein
MIRPEFTGVGQGPLSFSPSSGIVLRRRGNFSFLPSLLRSVPFPESVNLVEVPEDFRNFLRKSAPVFELFGLPPYPGRISVRPWPPIPPYCLNLALAPTSVPWQFPSFRARPPWQWTHETNARGHSSYLLTRAGAPLSIGGGTTGSVYFAAIASKASVGSLCLSTSIHVSCDKNLALAYYTASSLKVRATTLEIDAKASILVEDWRCLVHQAIGDVGRVEDVRVAAGLSDRTVELYGRLKCADYLFSVVGSALRKDWKDHSVVLRVGDASGSFGRLGAWCLILKSLSPGAYKMSWGHAFRIETPVDNLSVKVLIDSDGKLAAEAGYRLRPAWNVSVSAVVANVGQINSLPKLGVALTFSEQPKTAESTAQ